MYICYLKLQVINSYMKLLAKSFTDVYSFSTFFYPKLSNGGYKDVCRWAKCVDKVKQRLLLFPLHLEIY